MKIQKTHRIGLFDVDYEFKLRIESIARFFQEIAVHHSTSIGVGPEVLFNKGVVWFLSRLEMEVLRYPLLGEDIQIITWSRGFKGAKGFREYRINSDKGEIVKGSSVWLFYDFIRKRVARVPADISDHYVINPERWFDAEIDEWPFYGRIEPDQAIDISLRHSDIDVNGHVNNTVYIGFFETLCHKVMEAQGGAVKNLKIRYCREIDKDKDQVVAGMKKVNGVYHCNIHDQSELYADAEIIFMK